MGKLNTMHINVTADIETVYLSNYVTPVTYSGCRVECPFRFTQN